ncbi:hypothetical protein DLH85_20215 [Vibrio parahaemolyticus]|nr:hypothetical protein [Vibrio parahaemolyticus]
MAIQKMLANMPPIVSLLLLLVINFISAYAVIFTLASIAQLTDYRVLYGIANLSALIIPIVALWSALQLVFSFAQSDN